MDFRLDSLTLAEAAATKSPALMVLVADGFEPGADALSALIQRALGSGDFKTEAGALLSSYGAARVTAVDASADALAVAAGNAARLGLELDLRHGDWFGPLADERFELIVSNPPYIAADDPHLPALAHEPRQALVSGADGLHDIRRIIAAAPEHLAPGAWLLLEHGWDQAAAARALLSDSGWAQVQSRRDLAGVERCSGGQWPL